MSAIDENYLKCASDKFDLNSVFNLNLSHKNICNINKIGLLTNVEILDLSYNSISDTAQISSLQSAKIVDLSFNPIEILRFASENHSIEVLILKGCYINTKDSLYQLTKLKALKFVSFMNIDGTDANPVYGNCFSYNFEEYSRFVKNLIPGIAAIDSIRIVNRLYDNKCISEMDKYSKEIKGLVYKKHDWWYKNTAEKQVFNGMSVKEREKYITTKLSSNLYGVQEEMEEAQFMLNKLKSKIKDNKNNADSQVDFKNNIMDEYKSKLNNLEAKCLEMQYSEMKQQDDTRRGIVKKGDEYTIDFSAKQDNLSANNNQIIDKENEFTDSLVENTPLIAKKESVTKDKQLNSEKDKRKDVINSHISQSIKNKLLKNPQPVLKKVTKTVSNTKNNLKKK